LKYFVDLNGFKVSSLI